MIEAVIKVGGSLASQQEKLRALCMRLALLSQRHRFLVVPGGGEFADSVRMADKRFALSRGVSHRMAILGMDQYGFLLSDLISNSVTVDTFGDAEEALRKGKLPIFLSSHLLSAGDLLENSWEVTSDSIAAYIATRLRAAKLLLVKDVDGVYDSDPKKNFAARLLPTLSANQLLERNEPTSVDRYLPKLLLNQSLDCYIVNGLFPERVEAVLDDQKTICTLIRGD